MIVVKFELHRADGSGVTELGRLTVENLGDSEGAKPEDQICDYLCRVEIPQPGAAFPRFGMFRVNHYARKDGFLRLVQRAISRVVEELGYATEFKQS